MHVFLVAVVNIFEPYKNTAYFNEFRPLAKPKCCYSKFFTLTASTLKNCIKSSDKTSSNCILILLSWVKILQSNINGNILLSVTSLTILGSAQVMLNAMT